MPVHPGLWIIVIFSVINMVRFARAGKSAWIAAYAGLLVVCFVVMASFSVVGFYFALGLWVILVAIRMLKTPA